MPTVETTSPIEVEVNVTTESPVIDVQIDGYLRSEMFVVDVSLKHVPDSGYPGTFRWEFSATANEIANAAARGKKIVGHLVSALGNSPSFIELLFDGLSETDDVISATFKEITTTGITSYTVSGDSKVASMATVPFAGGGSALLVTFTESNGTWAADKTYAEVAAAVDAGEFVYAKDNSSVYYALSSRFEGTVAFDSVSDGITLFLLDDNSVMYDDTYAFATRDWVQSQGYLTQHQSLADYQTKSITDTGGYYTTDTVEGALQEIGAELAGINTLIGSGVIT